MWCRWKLLAWVVAQSSLLCHFTSHYRQNATRYHINPTILLANSDFIDAEQLVSFDAGAIEADEHDDDDAQSGQASAGGSSGSGTGVSRKKASLSEMSGGKGIAYSEYPREQHSLFKKREREKKAREKEQRDLPRK